MSPDWVSRVQRLEAEVAGLRRSMRSRGLIEQAKGVLAERLGVDVEEAFRHLVRTSQRTHVRVVDVAADVMATDRPGQAPDEQRRSTARVRAAAAATEDPDDLVAIAHEGVATLGARAVAVHLARPEGGAPAAGRARLVGATRFGLGPRAVGGPHSGRGGVAAQRDALAAGAIRANRCSLIGAGEHRTVVPLTVDESMPGPTAAMEFVWSQPVPPGERPLALLRGVTEAMGGWLLMNRHRWEHIERARWSGLDHGGGRRRADAGAGVQPARRRLRPDRGLRRRTPQRASGRILVGHRRVAGRASAARSRAGSGGGRRRRPVCRGVSGRAAFLRRAGRGAARAGGARGSRASSSPGPVRPARRRTG